MEYRSSKGICTRWQASVTRASVMWLVSLLQAPPISPSPWECPGTVLWDSGDFMAEIWPLPRCWKRELASERDRGCQSQELLLLLLRSWVWGRTGVVCSLVFICVQSTSSLPLTDSYIVWFFLIVNIAFITKTKRPHSILEILGAAEIWEKLQNNTLQIDVQPRNFWDCASGIFKLRTEFIRGKKLSVRRCPF